MALRKEKASISKRGLICSALIAINCDLGVAEISKFLIFTVLVLYRYKSKQAKIYI